VAEQTVLEIGSLTASSGEKVRGFVEVDLGSSVVALPIVLINGVLAGPRVAVLAGIHGCEYVAIAALRRVTSTLEPGDLTGSLVACLTCDPVAFAARSMYVSPLDGMNLNRAFPGAVSGTPTERLAEWLFRTVISPSDRFVDMHGGDLNESILSFSKYEETGRPEIDRVASNMAEAYALDYLMTGALQGSSTSAAAAAGIPAILAEVGSQGRWPQEDVELHSAGLTRSLATAGLLRERPDLELRATKRLHGSSVSVRASTSGYLHAGVTLGSSVAAGEELGLIEDVFGNVLEVVRAPTSGIILSLGTSLAMGRDDLLITVAEV